MSTCPSCFKPIPAAYYEPHEWATVIEVDATQTDVLIVTGKPGDYRFLGPQTVYQFEEKAVLIKGPVDRSFMRLLERYESRRQQSDWSPVDSTLTTEDELLFACSMEKKRAQASTRNKAAVEAAFRKLNSKVKGTTRYEPQ